MAIVSSYYVTDENFQVGGGKWTIEYHTNSLGNVYMVGPYLWDGIVNRDSLLTIHAEQISNDLAESEFDKMIGG